MEEVAELRITPRIVGEKTKIVILGLSGSIDSTTAPLLKKELLSLGQNIDRFIIDFNDVEFVSSAGWGAILARIRENREKGGDIVCARMIKEVYSIYELLELNQVTKYFRSIEESLEYFGETIAPSVSTTQQRETVEKRVVEIPKKLTIEEAICTVIKKNPLLRSSQIKRILQGPEFGFNRLSTLKVYFMLRRLDLNTREKRLYYAWQQEKKSKKE